MTAYALRERGESLPDTESKCLIGGCSWPGAGKGARARAKAQEHARETGHLVAVVSTSTAWFDGELSDASGDSEASS